MIRFKIFLIVNHMTNERKKILNKVNELIDKRKDELFIELSKNNVLELNDTYVITTNII